jgi:hypothetical protein
VATQASGSIGRGQGFLADLTRRIFGQPQEDPSLALRRAAQENQRRIEEFGRFSRGEGLANAENGVAISRAWRPELEKQARTQQQLALTTAERQADIQGDLETGRTGNLMAVQGNAGRIAGDLIERGADAQAGLNRGQYDHIEGIVKGAQGHERWLTGNLLGTPETGYAPFGERVLNTVTGENAAQRALEREIMLRNTLPAPLQAGLDLAKVGLFAALS